jgi:hypothetical protein
MKEIFDWREKRPGFVRTIFILVVTAFLAVTSCGRLAREGMADLMRALEASEPQQAGAK